MNKIFIQSDERWFENSPTITLSDEHLNDSTAAGAVCVGFLRTDSITETNETTSGGFDELPFMQFKTVSGSGGEYKSDFDSLKTSLVDNGDGRYFIPLSGEYSYTASLFYGSLSSTDELIFKTALFMKDHGYKPVVLTGSNSKALTYLLASENIDSITATYRKNG